MFLKSIEIRGFKSFADKTELNFKNGVTAVVGPNGSGKSNISDAVRWVLGEQSVRNLRGDKMEDVIFAGTQYRKPVGLAQVSLTLDNLNSELDIEYSDVTISRRLYRSGESDYLINNTSCRLKDVQALFMDTGIGKEGYSIIGQGKIDAILSGKSDDRRKLLEEAAGIVKYKTRKEEAEKKLENTEQNLIRIDDIISTYEERLEPLKNESEKAKRFLALSEDVKKKEINIIIDSIDNTKRYVENITVYMEKIKNEIIELNNNKSDLKIELNKRNNDLEEFNRRYEEKRALYYESKGKHQNIVSEMQLLDEKINSSRNAMERLDNLINNIRNEIQTEEKKLLDFKNKIQLLKEDQLRLNEDIKIIDEKIKESLFSIEGFNEKLKELENLKQKHQEVKNKTFNNIYLLKNNIDVTSNVIENLILDVQSHKNSLTINNSTKVLLEDEGKNIESKISFYEEEISGNKKEINSLKHSFTMKEKNQKDLSIKQSNTQARLNALINLENTYEGYNKSVKNLMQHISNEKLYKINKDCFVLGEVIKVDKEFETAIEIALGGSISHIVTTNENIAKDLINRLKTYNLGRATFLPMTIVKGRVLEVEDSIKNIKGYIGIASELVKYNSMFKGVVDNALGRTLVCNNMDNGLCIAKISGYKYRIVTLEGEVINPGGALTGGSYSKNANIMGRKREIEELRIRTQENDEIIEKLNVDIRSLSNDIKELDEKNLNLRDEIHSENIEITKVKEKIKNLSEEAVKLKNNMQKAIDELKIEEHKLRTFKEELKNKEESLIAIDNEINLYENEYLEINSSASDKNRSVEGLKENLTVFRVNKAKIDEMINNHCNEVERVKSQIRINEEKLKNSLDELNSTLETEQSYIIKKEENQRDIFSITNSIAELELVFKDTEIYRLKMKEKIPVIMAQIEDINLQTEKLDKDIHKQEVVLAKIQTEEEGFLEKLNEEYNLTFAEALDFKEEIQDVKALKEDVSILKSQISSLGIVNVGAIEEFKEVKEKFVFMNNQREDLVKSKEELSLVIDEMTQKMRKVFKENFEKLRINFNETFKDLFKGGRADLILQGEDELSAKIDINVEPPGKKLQNINLMSGGEKVLSAIALLFSILKMKPTPFCILDEIEAALDDVNVIRYGEFLKKFSENIQFIVITHRKGTMEASDMIYGVTMEEKGVSKVVSIDFTK